MRLRVFGSGSKGNCLAVRGGGKLLLVDCGLSCRELTKRMTACFPWDLHREMWKLDSRKAVS